jgi:adenylate cyclase class IV
MIEVEKRSFVSKEKYEQLINYFKSNNYILKEEKQVTTYFKGDTDFRLMNTPDYLKLWLKKGQIHDDAREEMNVVVEKKYETDLVKMLNVLGYEEEIKWYRKRLELQYEDFEVTIDYSIGYGYIVEFELMVNDESKVDRAKEKIEELFNKFDIENTPKEEFNNRYNDYKINWKNYTNNISDEEFLNKI